MESFFKTISVANYDYPLSDERIAKHPLKNRDISKLLVFKDNNIINSTFNSIVDEIKPNDLLVLNNTRVVKARLHFTKSTGSVIEVFLLNPINPTDYQVAFGSTTANCWNCIVGNLKRWKGETLIKKVDELGITLRATLLERTQDGAAIEFEWDGQGVPFAQIVEKCGEVPIPPYLNRKPEKEDKQRYQTVYADPEGSVAAPTAGLHFTREIIENLQLNGVCIANVTLHVGAGTFRPVKASTIGEHDMHTERIYFSKLLISSLLECKGEIVAVGTTSLRTLESLYWIGVKSIGGDLEKQCITLSQWECYSQTQNLSREEALQGLLRFMESAGVDHISANTQMIIVPGYKFRIVDRLVTNFHQPRSTLLLLVAAFIGERWKEVYQFALDNQYRFLSYGDSSILSPTSM